LFPRTGGTIRYLSPLTVGVLAVFQFVGAGAATAVTVSLSVGDVVVPLLTEAMLVTDPASRSACVMV